MCIHLKNIPCGTKLRTVLPIDDSSSVPVWIIKGKKEGRTLIITAGVHGCEYVGIEAVRRLWTETEPEMLSGSLVILPLLNSSGFYGGLKQTMAEDGCNLNRMFPGDENGTFSSRLAHAVEKHIFPLGDFLIDLHGGDINESLTNLLFFPVSEKVDQSVRAKALEGAKHLSVPYRIRSTSLNGLYGRANLCGLPAVLQETGCLGQLKEEDTALCLQSIRSLMGHLGIAFEGQYNGVQRESLSAFYLESPCDGLWYPCVHPDMKIEKGMELGHIEDIEGSILARFHAQCDGIVWYHTVSLGIRAGDPLVAYGSMEQLTV